MRQFIIELPIELDEAATLDGCSKFKIFFTILLPLCKVPLFTLGLMTFMLQWDGFIVPVTFITDESKMLLQVALTKLTLRLYMNDMAIMFSGIVVALIPIIIIFVFLQRYFVEGIASTGIKG